MKLPIMTIAILTLTLQCLGNAQDSFSNYSLTQSQTSFRSHADGTVTFQFKNTPIQDALKSLTGGRVEFFVDETVGKGLQKQVSFSRQNASPVKCVHDLLTAVKLRLVSTKDGYVVTATRNGQKPRGVVKSLNQIAFDRILDQPNELDMMETPLEMVAQFVGGMHQIRVEIDYGALRKARISPQTMVSLNAGSTLREALTSMLKKHGLYYRVVEGGLLITTKNRVR